jgi:hypothetical protein
MSHALRGGQASDQANARSPGRCRRQQRTSPTEGTPSHSGHSVIESHCHHRITSLRSLTQETVDPDSQSVFTFH